MKKWYVIQTRPREEERAIFFLRDKNVEIYSPRMEICTMAGVKRVMLRKPLFPNYIFARFDVDKDLFRISWTKGVQKVLPESVRPNSLDEAVIASIKSLADKDGIVRKQSFKKNDRVRITRGLMKDIMGIFEDWVSDTGSVRVLLDLLNYQARLELHDSLIEKTG